MALLPALRSNYR